MNTILRPDILVIGAGVAGCPLAVSLKRAGYDVMLVEKCAGPKRAFKGEFLQPRAVEYLKKFNFYKTFEADSTSQISHLRFRDVNHEGEITSSVTMNFPKGIFGSTIEYFDMLQSFLELTKKSLGESFWQGAELEAVNPSSAEFISAPKFTCTQAGRGSVTVEPKWVIGCDGRNSTVRKWMGGKTPGRNGKVVIGTEDEFIFGAQISEVSENPNRYEVIRTPEHGTISIFALGKRGQRIYFSAGPDDKKNLNEYFLQLLKDTQSLTNLKAIPEKINVSGYPANTAWFGPATKGAFLLVGDALAVTTPYGGQGMTIAMEHVQHLVENFDFNSESKSQCALMKSSYADFASKIHKRISFLNFGVYYTFFSRPSVFRYSTDALLKRWEKNPELKDRVARLFGGIDTDTPRLTEILDLERIPFSRKASEIAQRNIQWG